MKVAITGGRSFKMTAVARLWLAGELLELAADQVLHGDCSGADKGSASLAASLGYKVTAFPADWSLGQAAGPIRNAKMIAEADALLAFPGGRGTEDCVTRARRAGILVRHFEPREGA